MRLEILFFAFFHLLYSVSDLRVSFNIAVPYVGRVEALNLGLGQFTGREARFNEGLQWWQRDKQWHYPVIRNNPSTGDFFWQVLPSSGFQFVNGQPYQILLTVDFARGRLISFQIQPGLTVDLSKVPMPVWSCRDSPSFEPQLQLYARNSMFSAPAELLVKHVTVWNDDGSILHEDRFDRVRWHFGMSMKGGSVRAEQGAMRLIAPPGGGVDVFKRLGEPSW